jgi:tetratricopeptide (TPR) repeat protein
MDNSTKISIVTEFIDELKSLSNSESCLKLVISNFSVFDIEDSTVQIAKGFNWASEVSSDSKFDLILGDLPLAIKPNVDFEFGTHKLKIRRNWVEILNAVKLMKEDGLGIFLVEPTAFSSNEGLKVEQALNSEGFFISAIFNAPPGLLAPQTAITPVFIVITPKAISSIYVAELLNETQARTVASNYISSLNGGDLKTGIIIPANNFHSFHRIKIKQQIEKLETQYKEYEEYTLGELAVEINYVRSGEKLEEKANSIYIPKIGSSPVISEISNANIKHHNYFQVVLNDKAINEYVSAFFRSDIGKLILDSLTSGTFIPHLNKKELELALIALPTIDDQTKILGTQRKLHDLKQAIDIFDAELALNPNSSASILSQLDGMLEAIGGLTEIDKVLNIIRQGESKNIEFKETLSLDVKRVKNDKGYTLKKENHIELSVLKTVGAFLNTEGGTLLVGVNDNGEITGLDNEITKFHKSLDNFLLHFKNLIKDQVGEGFYPLIDYKVIPVSDKKILLVECTKSKSECFLRGKDFYVRTNPATDKLVGAELLEYVKNHFV